MGPFEINLENLSKRRPNTPEILKKLDFRVFFVNESFFSQHMFCMFLSAFCILFLFKVIFFLSNLKEFRKQTRYGAYDERLAFTTKAY